MKNYHGSLLRLLLTISFLEYSIAAAFSPHSSNPIRIKRATCSSLQFMCANKECISRFLKCDGHADCADKSDETATLCLGSPKTLCDAYSFQCKYGACIDGLKKCNGVQDCVDNSDEVGCGQNSTRARRSPAGLTTSTAPVAKPTCKPLVNPNLHMLCTLTEFPNGLKTIKYVDCSKPMPEGTKAIVKCPEFFKAKDSRVLTCSNGVWDKELLECEPLCGFSNEELRPANTNDSTFLRPVAYPWIASIHGTELAPDGTIKYQYLCGGSLITPNRVLTAAHCGLSQETDAWVPAQDMYVAIQVQRFLVREFRKPVEYSGRASFYQFDIAMIILDAPVVLSKNVLPVCLNFDPQRFGLGAVGKTPSWEVTNSQDSNDKLSFIDVPFVGPDECKSVLQPDEQKYYAFDKFCGGYKVKGPKPGLFDGGAGLTYKDGKINFEVGIVSTTLKRDDSRITFYTNVSYHADWIKQNM